MTRQDSGPIVATLQGVPLLASEPIRWRLQAGTAAVEEVFHVTPEGAQALKELSGAPVTLSIRVGEIEAKFANLYIIEFPAGPDPFIQAVRVADRRFWWGNAHVTRRYNMRRRVGVKRITNIAVPQQLEPVLEDVSYRAFSLKNTRGKPPGARWRADEIIEDVLKQAGEPELEGFGNRAPVTIFPMFTSAPEIENLEIDDTGAAAVGRALGNLPGASLFVNPQGRIVVFSKNDGRERQAVATAGPEIVGEGHVEVVPNRLQRPRAINVLFTREMEVRFNTGDSSANLFMTNVLPVPDPFITMAGKRKVQGQWVSIGTDLFNAWGATPSGFTISDEFLRRASLPFIDLWAPAQVGGSVDPNADWTARLAALQAHYRLTYRVNRKFLDNIVSFRAHRVATIDRETGTRAPSPVYMDWSAVPSVKPFFKGAAADVNGLYMTEHSGYAATIQADTVASPVRVSVLDADQGIIRFDFVLDPTKLNDKFIPGVMADKNEVPGWNPAAPGGAGRPVGFDIVSLKRKGLPELQAAHRAAVIITAVPGAPNSNRQFKSIRVEPGDVADKIPAAARFNLAQADGPEMTVRIGAGVETARYAWDDGQAQNIAFAFGLNRNGEAIDGLEARVLSELDALIINRDPATRSPNTASIEAIAQAEAARIYASFADRIEGTMAADINPDVQPAGWLDRVTFTLSPGGKATTVLSLPEKIPTQSLLSFLDAGTRAVLQKLVQPGVSQ